MAGYHVVAEIVKPLIEHLQKGRRLPTLVGALVGAAIGATSGLFFQDLAPAGALIGDLLTFGSARRYRD